jgi:hypothetical protein
MAIEIVKAPATIAPAIVLRLMNCPPLFLTNKTVVSVPSFPAPLKSQIKIP